MSDEDDLLATVDGDSGEFEEDPSHSQPRIGRYEILDRLGAGGMGTVFLAHDPELDRKVAIKLLHGGASQVSHARLVREAQAMAKLSHPNVAAVFDVGWFGKQVFMAMEYLAGGTLKQWLAKPRSVDEVLPVFIAAGRGLAAAHAIGLVHRDFKPANVLLSSELVPKVTDFGLVRSERVRSGGSSSSGSGRVQVVRRAGSGALPQAQQAPAREGREGDSAVVQPVQRSGSSALSSSSGLSSSGLVSASVSGISSSALELELTAPFCVGLAGGSGPSGSDLGVAVDGTAPPPGHTFFHNAGPPGCQFGSFADIATNNVTPKGRWCIGFTGAKL